MTETTRSPFGSLVHRLRRERRWTQTQLATMANLRFQQAASSRPAITARTIGAIERKTERPLDWHCPRQKSVDALIAAFELKAETVQHAALLEAATLTRLAVDRSGSSSFVAEREPSAERMFVTTGRETYLLRIALAVESAATGTPQALFISADPGTGKTWLLAEACRRAVRDHPDLVVLWGNCTGRIGGTDPYQPFRQVLRSMVGDVRSATPRQLVSSEQVERLTERIPVAIEALEHAGRELIHRILPPSSLDNPLMQRSGNEEVARQAAQLAEVQPSPVASEPDMAMIDVLQAYAAEAPVVLVLEDLHWTDTGTTSLLLYLLRRLRTADSRIVVLTSFRPGHLHEAGHPLPPILRVAPDLYPDPILDLSAAMTPELGRTFISELADRMAIDLSAEDVAQLQEQTLGLPIFVTGALQLLRADTPVVVAGQHLEPAIAIERIFDSQMDLLTPEAAQALVAASVQGHGFALEPLAIVLHQTVADLFALVERELIQGHRLVWPGGTTTINGHVVHEYQFSHILLRDHLYRDRMTDLERSHLHLETAEALLMLYGDKTGDVTSSVAHHLDQAGEVQRAGEAWLAAGNHAVDAGQHDRAETAFQRISELNLRLTAPTVAAEALVGLGVCARALSRPDDARALVEQGLAFAKRRRLAGTEAKALSLLGMLAYDAGRVGDGSRLVREAIALSEKTGDRAEASRSLARLSYNLHGLGLYDDAAKEAQRGLELARQLHNDGLIAGASIALANCWLDIGLFEQAASLHSESLVTAERALDHHRVSICNLNLALCAIEQGDWDRAEEANLQVLTPTRSVVPRFTGTARFQAGLIAEGRGLPGLARMHFQQSLDLRRRNGQHALQIDSLAGLLRTAVEVGDTGIARRLIADIDERVQEHGFDGIEHVARVCIAMLTGGLLVNNRSLANRYGTAGMEFLTTRASRLESEFHREVYLGVVPSHQLLQALVARLKAEDNEAILDSLASD